MYDNGDILLFTLSAWRHTSWRQFKQCFDEIQRRSVDASGYDPTEVATSHRWRALRELSALGHIDLQFGQDGIRVSAAPPVLATVPGFGTPKAVLCGARSPNFIEELQAASAGSGVELAIESQSIANLYAPSRVELRAEDPARIKFVADSIGIQYMAKSPARLLAHVSISLSEYLQNLEWSYVREINWRCEDFDTIRLQFRPLGESRAQRRLSRYQNPATTVWYYRLWQDGQSAEVDLDWGRYAVLAMESRRVMRHSPVDRKVLVPYAVPLPTLLARAFGLCSGHCPTLTEIVCSNLAGRYLEYRDVPSSIFNKVASKLEQIMPHSR